MLDVAKRQDAAPFDTARLDRLMDDGGMDVLFVTSKHNVQYLLGGHRAFFFESMDAMGLSRYLPVFVYARGESDKTGFFGHRMENYQNEVKPFWVSELNVKSSGSVDVMEKAVEYARKLNPKPKRIGAELAFLPADSSAVLGRAFPGSEIKDALFVLERLRANKSPEELKMLRVATDAVIDSMAAVFHNCGAGATKKELAEAMRREETMRGLLSHCGGRERQPRALGAALGGGRRALARFRRQLSWLYRRCCPHGHHRRTRSGAGRSAGAGRGGRASINEADPRWRARQGNLCRRQRGAA